MSNHRLIWRTFKAERWSTGTVTGLEIFFFFLCLLPVLNPMSYDGARVLIHWRPRAVLC